MDDSHANLVELYETLCKTDDKLLQLVETMDDVRSAALVLGAILGTIRDEAALSAQSIERLSRARANQ